MLFDLNIVAIDRQVYTGKAVSITVPTKDGEITILGDHSPLITTLKPGSVSFKLDKEGESLIKPEEDTFFAISSGVLEVKNNEVNVLLESVYKHQEIDQDLVLEAHKKAASLVDDYLKSEDKISKEDFIKAQNALEETMAQLRFLEVKRKVKEKRGK